MNKKFLKTSAVACMLSMVILALASCYKAGPISYSNSDEYTEGEFESTEKIEDLSVNWVEGNVKIEYHDSDKITVSESGKNKDKYPLYYRFKNDCLTIQFAKNGANMSNVDDKDVVISLPKTLVLDTLDINTISADVDINEIKSKDANIDSVSGFVSLDNCDVSDTTEINSVSGKVEAELVGKANIFKCNSTSGSIKVGAENIKNLDVNNISGDMDIRVKGDVPAMDIKTVSGAVDTYFEDGKSFRAEIRTVSGKIKCEHKASIDGKDYIVGENGSSVDIKTTSGNISINILK